MVKNDQDTDHSASNTTEISAVNPQARAILPVTWKQVAKQKLSRDNEEEQRTKRLPAVKREQPDIVSSFNQHSQPESRLGIKERSAGLSSAIAAVLSVGRK